MYCVKCGVRLQDGVADCPLCGTPVWNPNPEIELVPTYPDRYPERKGHLREFAAIAGTVLSVIACAVIMLICFSLYGALRWGGYAVFGTLLFYIVAVLPLWFRRRHPMVFLPVGHAAAWLYLLYICLYTGGRWFFPFAFPVVGLSLVVSVTLTALLLYTRGGRYFIFGGAFLAVGGCTMLIELFEHVAFDTGMFRWSLYSMGGCAAIGIFLLLAGIIRPLGSYLNRRFFV